VDGGTPRLGRDDALRVADGRPRDRPLLVSQFALGAVALYTLVTGAGRAIDALLSLAYHYDVPEALIGVTLVAVGTSLPELSAHVTASIGILSFSRRESRPLGRA
jgi:Ca2+/Na+ antiporter